MIDIMNFYYKPSPNMYLGFSTPKLILIPVDDLGMTSENQYWNLSCWF